MTRIRSTGGSSKTRSGTGVSRVSAVAEGRMALKQARGSKQKKTLSQRLSEELRKPRAARARRASETAKFVLVYNGLEDPDPKNVQRVMKTMAPANVTQVLPGTLSVEGDGAKIERKAQKLDLWSLSVEGVLSIPSPARTRFASQG